MTTYRVTFEITVPAIADLANRGAKVSGDVEVPNFLPPLLLGDQLAHEIRELAVRLLVVAHRVTVDLRERTGVVFTRTDREIARVSWDEARTDDRLTVVR